MSSSRTPAQPLALTVRDVAAELQLHPNTIRHLLLSGEIPGFKIGGAWRVPRSGLVRYLEQGRVS